jgi:hypothetical protein
MLESEMTRNLKNSENEKTIKKLDYSPPFSVASSQAPSLSHPNKDLICDWDLHSLIAETAAGNTHAFPIAAITALAMEYSSRRASYVSCALGMGAPSSAWTGRSERSPPVHMFLGRDYCFRLCFDSCRKRHRQ